MKLVRLNKKNAELLLPIRNLNRNAFLDTKKITSKDHQQWFDQFTGIQYLVYENEVLIGSLGITPISQNKAEIERVMLASSSFARQGKMTKALNRLIKRHPYDEYEVRVKKKNTGAIKFYLKNGFTIATKEEQIYRLKKKHPSPINQSVIPLLKPAVSQQEIQAVTKVLKSGWWGLGPVTAELEKQFAESVGVPFAVAVNSATAALHLAVHILKRKYPQKSNIICPALTFISTGAVGLYEGLEVRFADIDPQTLCLNPNDVASKVDKNTLAIIPVHYAGRLTPPLQIDTIPIIEDCAHAAGTNGAGSQGLSACWSFHPVKNIASGDGGMLTTTDPEIYEEAKRLRWLGIDQDTWSRERLGYNWEYQVPSLGFKYHLNDIQSSIILAQLNRLPKLNAKRQQIAKKYMTSLRHLPLTLPPISGSWHLFVIQLHEPALRPQFIAHMREHHISVGVHYQPLHHYPIFHYQSPLPVTDTVWPSLVDLPIHPGLTRTQQSYIIKVIKAFFHKS